MKAGRASIKSIATIMTMMMLMLISYGCTRGCNSPDNAHKTPSSGKIVDTHSSDSEGKKDLSGTWHLVISRVNQEMQIVFTENSLTITYYDGCQHMSPYTIDKNIIKFSFAAPKGKELCDAHSSQVNGEQLVAEFFFIRENGLFILLDKDPFYFERTTD